MPSLRDLLPRSLDRMTHLQRCAARPHPTAARLMTLAACDTLAPPRGRRNPPDFPPPRATRGIKRPLQHVAPPAGVDTSAAVAVLAGSGIGIVNLASKTLPKLAYQSYKKDGRQVYAAILGGRQYAFLAASAGDPSGGAFIYDMTQALTFDNCAEAVPATGETVKCPGVYKGRLRSQISVSYIAGIDNYVVLASVTSGGFDVLERAH